MLFYLYIWLIVTLIWTLFNWINTNLEASNFRSKVNEVSFIYCFINVLLTQVLISLLFATIYYVFYYIPVYLYNL